jgi:hypothetical protein
MTPEPCDALLSGADERAGLATARDVPCPGARSVGSVDCQVRGLRPGIMDPLDTSW